MRRGHSGPGSWRNENHRHFGPRSGGTPHFRPSRHYGPSDGPRFPPSGPRFRGPYPHLPCADDRRPPDHERYRGPRPNHPRFDRPHHNRDSRQILPLITHMRQKDGDHDFNQSNYYEDQFNTNAMGDVDLRQSSSGSSNSFNPRPIAPWVNAPFENRHYYKDNRSPHKIQRHQPSNESMPLHDFTGHRPPASDHYAAPPGPNNNNTPYSRSVDDTVDIVRKRLLNRDSQQPSDESAEPGEICEDLQAHSITDYTTHQEQPVKKKAQKLKPINKNNCDKMKNKIVHQLFKMDKGKIHKLMDNPSSSSKFEYAISSLITESQNSLNRHLRSVAEKSLCNSSAEFINNDNNTIYEDTFMKQMQCILDPQDTVLLEDIKPLVLAELSKVLQLDDFSSFQSEDYGSYSEHQYYNETHDQYQEDNYCDPDYLEEKAGNSLEFPETDYNQSSSYNQDDLTEDTKPLFERRPLRHRDYSQERQRRSESRQSDYSLSVSKNTDSQHSDSSQERQNKSIESLQPDHSKAKLKSAESRRSRVSSEISNDKFNELAPTQPSYDLEKLKNAVRRHARISNDIPDDTINDLGKPVPDYTEEKLKSAESRRSRISSERPNDDTINELCKPQPDYTQEKLKSAESRRSRISSERPNDNLDELPGPVFDPNVEQLSEEDDPFADLDNQYHVAVDHNFIKSEDIVSLITPSPVKSPVRTTPPRRSIKMNSPKTSTNIRNEIDNQLQTMAQSPLEKLFSASNYTRLEPETIKVRVELTKTNSTPTKQLAVEQKVPEPETDKFNNTDVNNTKSSQLNSRKRSIDQKPAHRKEKRKKISESQDASKSMSNLLFSNIDTKDKDTSRSSKKESTDKNYLEKYVKRKETPRKSKDPEGSNHETQNTSSHSNKSQSDSAKPDPKTKLKSIDIFNDQPKKAAAVHQAHRNTSTPLTSVKSPDENKLKVIPLAQTSFARKLVKRHVGTQVVKKSREKEVQTNKQKHLTKAIQTEPITLSSEKPKSKAKDPFERMKEIDMEIQVLLQEKFKLYNSLESKNNGGSTMETLGMTVLNMPIETTEDTSSINEDEIVDDFTNIPVEELEQIAMETVQESKRRPKRKIAHTRKSESPTTKRSNRKSRTPNISLIEQIITDDRPLEDIISLDDFETTPKSKKKIQKSAPKKKTSKKKLSKQILSTIPESRPTYPDVKDCSVVLIRTDIAKYLNRKTKNDHSVIENVTRDKKRHSEETLDRSESCTDKFEVSVKVEDLPTIETFKDISLEHASQIVEEVVNDLQFDMLDVSEDIIIGDSCELKSGKENEKVQITEEIILDNSQSSMEDTIHEPGSSYECKMYDYSTDENLRKDSLTVVGNADVVLAIECIENDFIAACLDGNVYHFSGDGQLVNTLKGSNLGVTCLTIVKEKYGTTVYTGSLDSRIRYYDLETGLEKGPECNVLSPIQTMDRAWDTVFVGTRTGFVLQFECKNNMLIPVSTVKFSEQSILALRAMKEGPRKVLLVAARSEDVTVKDAQTGLLLRTLSGPKMTVYTLLFEDGKVYCGTSSPQIHVFDYTSGSHVGVHEGGKGAVCLRAMGGLVFAGCYDGCVYIYREGETRALAQLRGPSLMLLSLCVRGSKIIAGYKDRSLYIWKLPLAILQEMIL